MRHYITRYADTAQAKTRLGFLLSGFLLISFALPVLAESIAETSQINWLKLGMGLFGGLAMFLFGMEQMSDGLKAAAGDTLKVVLAKLTRNRFMGALTGAFVTAILNSSSVTTVLVVGFITAGFMSLSQSVGVIMGANIGSTVTAQIVAFNVTQYALILVAVGFFMLFAAKREKMQHYGTMIMGLGLVFYGMGVMGDAMTPLRSYPPFLDLMIRMESPLLGILVGALFTGLVQSSAATTGIAIVMAAGGLISLPAGIALAFGANIGTCVTALLASMGKPVEAKRAAMVHIIFNIAGVALWVMFIPQLAEFIVSISPSSTDLTGKARMAADVPRQIANAHTVFNIANTLIFIGFTGYFARLVERLLPDIVIEEKVIIEPRFLDMDVVSVPALALEQTRYEIGHMGEIITQMFTDIFEANEKKDLTMLDDVRKLDDKVDILNERILAYLSDIRQETLTDQQSDTFQALMSATINLENVADVIQKELVDILSVLAEMETEASEATRLLLINLYDKVKQSLHDLMKAIREDDEIAAQEVLIVKEDIQRITNAFLTRQSERIGVQDESHLDLVRLEMELLDKLRQIYTLAKRVAKDFVPQEIAEKA